ncbi:MAG: ABC transporter substrate-binding protein [Planctomycetes bacterium]|nr:ABC transporter substrate-binding protein [Planctomycetota bacterium]MCL4730177.1 ABC transporter substrate-binding protein [Planctomycetota bacterium]
MRKALGVLALMAVALAAGCGTKIGPGFDDKEVNLGLFVSTSGEIATFGEDTKKGVELAIEEINAAGGIKGKKIKLTHYDTASKPEEGKAAATKLATQDGVFVAMGAVASGISLAAAPEFQKYGIPMISPSSTNPTVTEQGNYIFRICYLDDFQGAACAVFAMNDLKAKKAAILQNQDDAYSTGLADFFEARFKKAGGTVVAKESYKKGTTDFNTQVTNIKAKSPDVVFLPCYYNDAALIAQQCRAQGLNVPLLGGDGWESDKLVPNAKGALEGCYFGNHYAEADENARVKAFVEAYRKKYGNAPSSLAALGYDVVYVVKKAIEDAGEFDRAKVRDALAKLKGFEGVTGKFDIDERRDARKSISMLKIEGEKFKFVRQINPSEVE